MTYQDGPPVNSPSQKQSDQWQPLIAEPALIGLHFCDNGEEVPLVYERHEILNINDLDAPGYGQFQAQMDSCEALDRVESGREATP